MRHILLFLFQAVNSLPFKYFRAKKYLKGSGKGIIAEMTNHLSHKYEPPKFEAVALYIGSN
jgi:hypothetical protein